MKCVVDKYRERRHLKIESYLCQEDVAKTAAMH